MTDTGWYGKDGQLVPRLISLYHPYQKHAQRSCHVGIPWDAWVGFAVAEKVDYRVLKLANVTGMVLNVGMFYLMALELSYPRWVLHKMVMQCNNILLDILLKCYACVIFVLSFDINKL